MRIMTVDDHRVRRKNEDIIEKELELKRTEERKRKNLKKSKKGQQRMQNIANRESELA